jgi:predicted transglutaminase-like cysteine proteinase
MAPVEKLKRSNTMKIRSAKTYTPLAVILAGLALVLVTTVTNLATPRHFSEDLLDRVSEKYGEDAAKRLNALGELVDTSATLDEKTKVKVVNDFFNTIPYYTDSRHWKQKDYWATPVEKLGTYGGDCEDYAIAKYYTLRELGLDEKKLRIMYVKAIEWNEAHMVLAYYPEPSLPPLVLDNINKNLKPSTERKDLIPVFSFNANGLYLAKAQGTGKRVGGPEKMKLWSNMMKRMDGSEI